MKWLNSKESRFLFLFSGVFLLSFVVLYMVGLIPNELVRETGDSNFLDQLNEKSLESISGSAGGNGGQVSPAVSKPPVRIEAASINLDFNIENPSSDNYKVLDSALMRGAVHYPGSGGPAAGNMFIFGHSTSYKIVNNKAYQVFNNIHNLKEGDEIKIYSEDHVYSYKVSSVRLEKDTNVYVNFATKENRLTLATCNSFGQKEDRYVVEADYVGISS